MKLEKYCIYNFHQNEDGSWEGNGTAAACAGLGVYFGEGHTLNAVSGRATNNCREFQAAALAIRLAKQQGITVKNQVDVEELDRELADKSIKIKWSHVDVDCGILGNERADALARENPPCGVASGTGSSPSPKNPSLVADRLDRSLEFSSACLAAFISACWVLWPLEQARRLPRKSECPARVQRIVEQECAHQSFKVVSQSVAKFQLVAQVQLMRVQHKFLQVELFCEYGEMLILDDRCAVPCKATWEKIAGLRKLD
ncbi:conserved hypothetical protein [Culex quinquefasciatus]|uniref:RNase H type-1 domain-containing protein n=1 Tax=Culex quinquefasciatus TaxID=7176 RepID=B0WJA0_CULQU|nr:conserved hypothetical protein [Culex quinquefasciatus]|eukprot:XP_001848784.1 conserved hypothetical protein [Culex quinquefasciatus]